MDKKKERYQEINSSAIDRWCLKGWKWGKMISHQEYLDALQGKYDLLLTPTKPLPKEWIKDIRGKTVLGLAAGGGQEMPILNALGAYCTVLDYSEEQLKREKETAEREKYQIKIVKADMTKPLPFENDSFDYVINPVSLVYIEKEGPIFKEVYRVLKKGGHFIVALDNGINFITDDDKTITNSLPFNPLKDKKLAERLMKEDDGYQFSHTLEESIGGLIQAGFAIKGIYEDINDEGHIAELNIPSFFTLLCQK
jgi:ubiquinone/menaquinone biosynthesis C-methylase UbiE